LVIASLYIEKAAHELVTVRKAAMLPAADLQGSYTASWDGGQSASIASQDARVMAQLTIPLYQGGRAVSQLRSAKHDLNTAMIQVDEQRRRARQAATSSWYGFQSTQSIIPARMAQLDAARVAQDGVQAEYDVGTKTILDVLAAEQQTLEASVALTRARVDRVVAGYNLVAASGDLTATLLGLPVNHFDVRGHYAKIKEQRFTFGLGY
jgi:outer membrane protein TolC